MSTHNGSPRHRDWKIGCKVYIGNLAETASKEDVEVAFSKYGTLRNVWVARNPPGFAFVEFEDGRDAEDACRHLDGTRIAGARIKAEMSHGRSRRGGGGGRGGPPGYRGGGPGYHPGGHYGSARGMPRDYYNGGGGEHHYGGSGGGGYRDHHGPSGAGGYMDRGPRDRYPPRPRSPVQVRDHRNHYPRSRSNSLEKSPPPPPPNRTAARPRTPPSRSVSPERH